MKYPTELQEILREQDAKGSATHKRKCWASENGGCFCTGKCEGKPESTGVDQLIYRVGDKS